MEKARLYKGIVGFLGYAVFILLRKIQKKNGKKINCVFLKNTLDTIKWIIYNGEVVILILRSD